MSSRRGAGEDNILAMLERDSARRASPRISGVRLAWYGAAAAFTGILAGGVAWLAYDNHQTGSELQAQYQAAAGAERSGAAGAITPPPLAAAGAAGVVAAAPDPALAAVVVDERPRMRTAPPPMVMLPPHEAAAAKPTVAPVAPAVAAAAPRATATPPADAARPATATSPTDAARPTAASATARPGEPKFASPRPLARVADKAPDKRAQKRGEKRMQKPAKGKTADTRPAARRPLKAKPDAAPAVAAVRGRKGNTPAAAGPQADGDVALISAIISQSERHRGERDAAGTCGGTPCPPKAARP